MVCSVWCRIAVAFVVGVLAAGLSPGCLAADQPDHYGIRQVRVINERIAAGWKDAGLEPSPLATDGEWCRRVFLDLIGRVPTLTELQAFTVDSSASKKADLVARLLGDDYVDEYARNFTDVWTTVLIGRDATNANVNRSGMRQYLRRGFSKNIPYDRFMEELVTASGANTNRRGVAGFNGATNFLSGKMEEMGGGQRSAGDGQDSPGFSRSSGAMHPVPQPSVQQGQAKPVLGIQRFLPPDRCVAPPGWNGRRAMD